MSEWRSEGTDIKLERMGRKLGNDGRKRVEIGTGMRTMSYMRMQECEGRWIVEWMNAEGAMPGINEGDRHPTTR